YGDPDGVAVLLEAGGTGSLDAFTSAGRDEPDLTGRRADVEVEVRRRPSGNDPGEEGQVQRYERVAACVEVAPATGRALAARIERGCVVGCVRRKVDGPAERQLERRLGRIADGRGRRRSTSGRCARPSLRRAAACSEAKGQDREHSKARGARHGNPSGVVRS